jgi:hypothetical protein
MAIFLYEPENSRFQKDAGRHWRGTGLAVTDGKSQRRLGRSNKVRGRMKFGVLALDNDGTIAQDGVLCPDVKIAIAEARARGIVVILVTGRILSDLRGAAGDLKFVDAVVAENGAVLTFPNGEPRIVGHPPPQIFFDELRRRGVVFKPGQCVVEADASTAPTRPRSPAF